MTKEQRIELKAEGKLPEDIPDLNNPVINDASFTDTVSKRDIMSGENSPKGESITIEQKQPDITFKKGIIHCKKFQ